MLDPGAQLCPTSATGTSEAKLFLATERGDLKEMRRILEDADPNVPVMTQHGPMTCLMEAAKSEHVAVLQLLLDSAAATEIKEQYGGTAFHFACGRGTCQNVDALIQAGANTEAKDVEGRTGLMVATIGGRPDVLEVLAAHNVRLDTLTGSGWTAFHWACYKGQSWHADCVEVLVLAGCDQEAKTEDGLTGKLLATIQDCKKVLARLEVLNAHGKGVPHRVLVPGTAAAAGLQQSTKWNCSYYRFFPEKAPPGTVIDPVWTPSSPGSGGNKEKSSKDGGKKSKSVKKDKDKAATTREEVVEALARTLGATVGPATNPSSSSSGRHYTTVGDGGMGVITSDPAIAAAAGAQLHSVAKKLGLTAYKEKLQQAGSASAPGASDEPAAAAAAAPFETGSGSLLRAGPGQCQALGATGDGRGRGEWLDASQAHGCDSCRDSERHQLQ